MPEELSPYCHHFHRAMEVVGNRWSGEILRALLAGKSRFSELAAAIPGLSDRLLSERLKVLESEGIVTRDVDSGPPVRVSYNLTRKGRELVEPISALANWADRWITPEEKASTRR